MIRTKIFIELYASTLHRLSQMYFPIAIGDKDFYCRYFEDVETHC